MNNSKENNIIVFLFSEKRKEKYNNNKITVFNLGTNNESVSQVALPIKDKNDTIITSCILISRAENIKEDIKELK